MCHISVLYGHSVRQFGRLAEEYSAIRSDRRYHSPVLDDRDAAIIAALQEDGRATFADIAKRVGMAPSTVHERVRKLELAGAIKGYRAEVDAQALGLFVTALVSVTPLDPRQPDDLPDRVSELDEVEDCHSVAGEESYILKVRTRTTADLEDLLRRIREKAEVQTRTTIVLSTPFEHRPIASS
jgi:Lrp/AsnC family leucine-responsive transcriptional regulator